MYLRADLGKEIIIVNVGRPHGLIHIGHKTEIRTTENCPGQGGAGEPADFLIDLLPASHHDFHILPRHSGNGS